MLYDLYQRYDFESKSQHSRKGQINYCSCMTYTKGTTLKANHNMSSNVLISFSLYDLYQRYDFESKSQQFPGSI